MASQTSTTQTGTARYPLLFSPWQLRNLRVKNRVIFPPTCPSWITDPWNAVFTDMATAYYEERARGGVGLIIIGATHVHPDSIIAPLLLSQLFDDRNVEPLSRIAEACHRHDCKLGIQLTHTGLRGSPVFKKDPAYHLDATWYTAAPSQVPLGEFPGSITPKELSEEEIWHIVDCFAQAAARARQAGVDGVELHANHGYLAWEFLSPLYNKRADRWGGSYDNRLRFLVEVLRRMREGVGDDRFVGYRINSTSFWPNDLEPDDLRRIVQDVERLADIDYVSVSAGVHHAFIHTPMEFEPGWERGYARSIKEVSSKPVFVVGRITTPDVAEQLLREQHADAVCLARQLFTDPEWANKAQDGREEDIRRCVAANYCWKSVSLGGRVQCIYNPAVGREREWGAGSLHAVREPKRILVVGAGPAGLEYARVAAARGHEVHVREREPEVGGHVRVESLLPSRGEYRAVTDWLLLQASKNGADVRTSSPVTGENLQAVLADVRPDHVVLSTGARVSRSGFQGWTGEALQGWERGRCAGWDEVVLGSAGLGEEVLVVDELCDVIAPLTAVHCAEQGARRVRLLTRFPMVGMDTVLDVYLEWLLPKLYRAGVEMITDHFVRSIDGDQVSVYNVYAEELVRTLRADLIVMVTARQSENDLLGLVTGQGPSVETIGDATAPRGTYDAVFEAHRQARLV